MDVNVINITNKRNLISDLSKPKIIAQTNNYYFKLTKFKGEFIWHKHDESNETFYIIAGALDVHFRNSVKRLESGKMIINPLGA